MQRQRRQPPSKQNSHISTDGDDDPPPAAKTAETASPLRRVGHRSAGPSAGSRFSGASSLSPVSFSLHLLGAALGIYQLGRLYGVLNPTTLGTGSGGAIGVASNVDSTSGRVALTAGAAAAGAAAERQQQQRQHQPIETEDATSSGISSARTKAATSSATLFPPYMFYTAANLTKAEENDRLYRSHCRDLNPSYELVAYDDGMSRNFVAENFPEWLSLYDGLDVPVMRADMWRYLILYHFGGVYFDGDVDCKRPIDEWGEVFGISKDDPDRSAKLGGMVGIEYRRPARGISASYPHRLQFAQWTMAGQPRHPIYYRTIELINDTIADIRAGGTPPGDAVYITGPVQFSRAVVDFMVDKGRITRDQIVKAEGNNDILVNDSSIVEGSDMLVDNLAILHENAFAYRGKNRGAARNENHETVYARHWYRGGWKPNGWKEKTSKYAMFKNLRIKGQ